MQDAPDPRPDTNAALLAMLEGYAVDANRLEQLSPEQRKRLLAACGRLIGASKSDLRQERRAARSQAASDKRRREQAALRAAALRRARSENKVDNPALPAHALPMREAAERQSQLLESQLREAHIANVLSEPRSCYICKEPFSEVHFFYDSMCANCGDFNFHKRGELANLSGRVALVTGGRVKIGQEIVLKLLRCGARVIVTTRFAADAARRYAEHEDFAEYRDRLQIFGLDLRHTPSIEALCAHLLKSLDRLDFLINNACQTVRRPAAFYKHLLADERRASGLLSEPARALLGAPDANTGDDAVATVTAPDSNVAAAEMSQFIVLDEDAEHDPTLFPEGTYDVDQQQVDLRKINSWRLRMHQVSTPELLEVQLVNAVAPFVLNARLKPLMERVATADKHVVNVSAVEGQFNRGTKTDKHPHTNMAKAALNMMTRTSAPDYQRSGIFMNSVDTGWVTDEDPAEHALRKEQEGFQPPLDIVDGAARVCDPIINGHLTGEHVFGRFLKDYVEAAW
jgi:NAD(P)-dependent dehydrogenase (short-subunit alcohol dehydrogenase family)